MPANLRTQIILWQILALILFSTCLAIPALAVDYTWDGGGITNDWTDGDNWDPNAPAGGPVATDTIRFNAAANVNLVADRTVAQISLNTANVVFSDGFNLRVTDIQAETTTAVNMNGGALITTGVLRDPGGGNIGVGITNWQMTGNGGISTAGTLTYGSVISGSGSLTITGGGTVNLTGLNTYTGATTVAAGTLVATGAGMQLPVTTSLIISGGASCVLDDQDFASLDGAGDLTILGVDLYMDGPGNHYFSGNVNEVGISGIQFDGPGSHTLTGMVVPDMLVSNGTLIFNGGCDNEIIIGGGTLTGSGATLGPVSAMFGDFSPGNGIGSFLIGFALGMTPASRLIIDVNSTESDRVTVDVDSIILIDPVLSVRGTPTQGNYYRIINNNTPGAVGGNFAGLSEGATFESGGYKYKITYVGGDGNDVVLQALTGGDPGPDPPPEPRPAPVIPQGESPNPTTSLNGPQLTWEPVSGSNFYRIYRADCPTCTRSQVGQVQGASFTDQSAIPGQPYYYWVRTESEGGLSGYSNWMVAWRYEQNPGRAGDFNQDGIMDLMWWEPHTNQLEFWLMNHGEVQAVVTHGYGLDISQWLLINTGDFNGDGLWELLWWNPGTGEVMAGFEPFEPRPQPRSSASSADAQVIGSISGNAILSYTGDLNGDGRCDILWRDYATGQVTLWLMGEDGTPQYDGPPTSGDAGFTSRLNWQAVGLSDSDASGRADVVWRNANNNRFFTWFMDGAAITGVAEETRTLATSWRATGLGDLDGDKMADVVWQNESDGTVQVWLMQYGLFSQERVVTPGSAEASSWQVKAVGNFCNLGADDIYCKNEDSGAVLIMSLDGEQHHPTAE
jgi:autotransporter-associated beta strand protein